MPTYEYRCPDGHEFEIFQRMSDDPVATCPDCGKEAERVISAGAGFLFKGEGFYITDYRSEEYKKKARSESEKKEGGSAPAGSSSAGSSGETSAAPDAKKSNGSGGTSKKSDKGSG